MKKKLLPLIVTLVLCSLCACSSSDGGSPDPLAEFRTIAADLRQESYDALIQTTDDKYSLPPGDPAEGDYLIALEDLLIISTYDWLVFNRVIEFQIQSVVSNVYTNAAGATITVDNGIYAFSMEEHIIFEQSQTAERVRMDFTYDTTTERWLIIGLRGGDLVQDPSDPWFKEEGEIVGATDYYKSTTFFYEEEGVVHPSNTLLRYSGEDILVQMACERTACAADCVDTSTTVLYSQGLTAAGLTAWDDYKLYGFSKATPDYEIP